MRHNRTVAKLGVTASHRKAMMQNMVNSLFTHEKIKTTLARAKAAKQLADKIFSFTSSPSELHGKRLAFRQLQSDDVVELLFGTLKKRYEGIHGSISRVVQLVPRPGDNAKMAIVELINRPEEITEKVSAKKVKKEKAAKDKKAADTAKKDAKVKKDAKAAKAKETKTADDGTEIKKSKGKGKTRHASPDSSQGPMVGTGHRRADEKKEKDEE